MTDGTRALLTASICSLITRVLGSPNYNPMDDRQPDAGSFLLGLMTPRVYPTLCPFTTKLRVSNRCAGNNTSNHHSIPWRQLCLLFPFSDKETEVQQGQVIRPSVLIRKLESWGLSPFSLTLEAVF